uniref:Glycosyl transferase CAP10 domain-containing protein n=1 Tax=Tetradesmus obliquus TaxID=3088 RepID=A0A383W761_TETOB|eukprot:jgi/Sobl393_1/10132/SZX79468.1
MWNQLLARQRQQQLLQQQQAQQLLLLVLSLLLLGLRCAADEASFCLRSVSPPDAAGFARGSRRMPPKVPILAAYDWNGGAADQQQLTSSYKPCHAEAPIFRYKVVKGVVYVDHDHSDARYKQYRDGFLEQLVLAMFLYKDFPDVDLVVDFTDHPQLCDQRIPFLRFSIFNASGLGPPQQQQQYNITELLAPAWVPHGYASRLSATAAAAAAVSDSNQPTGQQGSSAVAVQLSAYTRGFTIPSPEAWRALSLTPPQLQEYQRCLQETYPWSAKRRVLFWRGQATGCSRGWPIPGLQHTTAAAAAAAAVDGLASIGNAAAVAVGQQPQPHLLRNKRVQAVLRLFPYAHVADVGISSLPQLTPECLGMGAQPGTYRRRKRQPLRVTLDEDDEDEDGGIAAERHPGGVETAAAAAVDEGSKAWQLNLSGTGMHWNAPAGRAALAQADAADSAAATAGDAGSDEAAPDNPAMTAHAFRALAYLLHGEAVGLEAWASCAATLSIDGYGPPFRLPQQLLLPSAVLKQASPYQSWLDWDLQPGVHYQQFVYDLSDLEEKAFQMLGVGSERSRTKQEGASGATLDAAWAELRGMAEAAHSAVAAKVDVFAQLDAFAWSVARYKEACPWDVAAPAAGERVFHVVQLNPSEMFNSPGVPESVRLLVMQQLRSNFAAALKLPAYAAAAAGGG